MYSEKLLHSTTLPNPQRLHLLLPPEERMKLKEIKIKYKDKKTKP